MKRIKLLTAGFIIAVFGVFAFAPVATVGAIDPLGDICTDNPNSEVCQSKGDSAGPLIQQIVNVMLFIVGTLSVLMIIVGGILYTISAGDASKMTRAKNTILYAIVGLVVAFLAFAIVNWVIGKLIVP